MRELALFSGGGGGILGGILLGWRTVCVVELDPYCRRVLLARQRDGLLPKFPIWDDVQTFDGRPWRGHVDIVTGGFPCQDISSAGRGAGITGERSGLWSEMARIIGEVRPRFALVENSPILTCRGLGVVLGDLAEMGYDARWGVLGAEDAIWSLGAPCIDHERARIWIVATDANNDSARRQWQGSTQSKGRFHNPISPGGAAAITDAVGERRLQRGAEIEDIGRQAEVYQRDSQAANGDVFGIGRRFKCSIVDDTGGEERAMWWSSEPGLDRVVHGMANRVDRARAIGNGQVPAVVRLAWLTLTDQMEHA